MLAENITQHATPGPWKVSALDSRSVGPSRVLVISEGEVPQFQTVAIVMLRTGETDANARLIAAAPALRDALKAVSTGRVASDLCWCADACIARSHEHSAACLAARAAMATVEGR